MRHTATNLKELELQIIAFIGFNKYLDRPNTEANIFRATEGNEVLIRVHPENPNEQVMVININYVNKELI